VICQSLFCLIEEIEVIDLIGYTFG